MGCPEATHMDISVAISTEVCRRDDAGRFYVLNLVDDGRQSRLLSFGAVFARHDSQQNI
jgi:hypothetical protein